MQFPGKFVQLQHVLSFQLPFLNICEIERRTIAIMYIRQQLHLTVGACPHAGRLVGLEPVCSHNHNFNVIENMVVRYSVGVIASA